MKKVLATLLELFDAPGDSAPGELCPPYPSSYYAPDHMGLTKALVVLITMRDATIATTHIKCKPVLLV